MDKRYINEEYCDAGMELIESEDVLVDIRNSQASIIFLSSEHKKVMDGKAVFGQCERVPDKYRWGIPADFTITIFEPNVEGFSNEQIRILLLHELLHVGIEFKDGEERYFCRPHDLEDFKYIIDRFGTAWSEVDGGVNDEG